MNIKKTALYVRVSTEFQAEKGYSIDAQLDKLKAYCSLHNIDRVEQYVDAGCSAASLERPEMQRLIYDIAQGKLEKVIVYKLDRLSRKTKDTLHLIEDVFNKYHISFVSISENIDTTASSGKLFLTMLSSIAQFERENILERTKLGIAKKASLGLKSRTPKLLIGYDYLPTENRFVVNPYEAMQVREIFSRYESGYSIKQIFDYMTTRFSTKYGKYKSIKNIQNILDNQTYLGKFLYQGTFLLAKNVEQIIEDDLFNKVQIIRKANKKSRFRVKTIHLLSGLLVCGECGNKLRAHKKHNSALTYYICYGRDNSIKHMQKSAKRCSLPYINYEQVNKTILLAIDIFLGDNEFNSNIAQKTENKGYAKKNLCLRLQKLNRHKDKIVELMLDDVIPKELFLDKLKECDLEIEQLNRHINVKNIPAENKKTTKEPTYHSIFSKLNISQKRVVLNRLIKKIEVHFDSSLKIFWKV